MQTTEGEFILMVIFHSSWKARLSLSLTLRSQRGGGRNDKFWCLGSYTSTSSRIADEVSSFMHKARLTITNLNNLSLRSNIRLSITSRVFTVAVRSILFGNMAVENRWTKSSGIHSIGGVWQESSISGADVRYMHVYICIQQKIWLQVMCHRNYGREGN